MKTVQELNEWGRTSLPGLVGFEITAIEPGRLSARMPVRSDLLAPHGFLHAASVVALADSACGYGTMYDLPDDAKSFTTIELKTNFLGTAREGIVSCDATRMHNGRSTQVWDAVVRNDAGKAIALFRCTQILLR
jgi:1,4-dihydroxy-2-naphthoyl-CoA hydrolase